MASPRDADRGANGEKGIVVKSIIIIINIIIIVIIIILIISPTFPCTAMSVFQFPRKAP